MGMVGNSFKTLLLVVITSLLAGCPPHYVPDLFLPLVSSVEEDGTKQKYVVNRGNPNDPKRSYRLRLYTWDSSAGIWIKKMDISDPLKGEFIDQFYLDKLNVVPKSAYLYKSYNKTLFQIDLNTSQVSQRQFPNNYSIVSADEFVVYEGRNVKLHTLSTNVISNLHMLPSIASIATGLGLNIDATQYQMLCTPEASYQWDYKTHYCIVGNLVGYGNIDYTNLPNINHFYEMNITVNMDGSYTYKLLYQGTYDAHSGAVPYLRERIYRAQDQALVQTYASVIQSTPSTERADTYSIDSQGNLHLFYVLKGSPDIHYAFYDKANPTTPLYQQVLP
jgi:hypothetical protein